jgi:radical SAM protein with 4Fe4S-binding SPASM domain
MQTANQPSFNRMADRYPRIRSFITTRREYFGGYMFNPYLLRHLSLDHREMDLASKLDGSATLEALLPRDKASDQFELDELGFRANLFAKLNQIYAVDWYASAAAGRAAATETPTDLLHVLDSQHLSAPLSVLWDVTYTCNLHCKHCLSSAGKKRPDELTTDEGNMLIDQLADAKVFTITFCGGEPLARKDLIRLMRRASSRDLGLKLSTNGTLLNDKWLRAFEDTNLFGVQVSLDGDKTIHDRMRGMPGAYDKAVRAIRSFVETGYFTVVAPVVTRMNIDQAAFKPSVFLPLGRGSENQDELRPPKDKFRRLIQTLKRKQTEYASQIEIELEAGYPESGSSDCNCLNDFPDGTAPVGCSAGNTQLVITADGNVVACPFLYDFVAGNLRRERLQSIWDNSAVLQSFRDLKQRDLKGACGNCPQVPKHCQGGCRAAAYLATGDLYATDPLCWLESTAQLRGTETTKSAVQLPWPSVSAIDHDTANRAGAGIKASSQTNTAQR